MPSDDVTAKEIPAILLIDQNPSARRSVVLSSAVTELNEKENWGANLVGVETVLPTQKDKIKQFLRNHSQGIIFVAITENDLSTLSNGNRLPRKPCDSISCAFEIIGQIGESNDLYFLTRNNITGVDAISMLLSGARGVIDMEALGSAEVIKCVIRANRDTNKNLSRILVGDPYTKLDRLIDTIKNQVPIGHWNLLLALAEIPRVRLDVSGNANQIKIASALSKWKDITGFQGSEDVTRRHLASILNIIKGWIDVNPEEDEYEDDELFEDDEVEHESRSTRQLTRSEMQELPYLPTYARMFGLPRRLIPIRDADESKLGTQLFRQGIMGMYVKSPSIKSGIKIGRVTMPTSVPIQKIKRNRPRHAIGEK